MHAAVAADLRLSEARRALDQGAPVSQTGFHCARCTFELAHLKVAPNRVVRQLLRRLLAPGERLQGRYRVSGVFDQGGRGHPGLLTCA